MNREPIVVERRRQIIAGTILAGLALAGCGSGDQQSRYKACEKFGVSAQNRWAQLSDQNLMY